MSEVTLCITYCHKKLLKSMKNSRPLWFVRYGFISLRCLYMENMDMDRQRDRKKVWGTHTQKYMFKTVVAYIYYTEAVDCVSVSQCVRLHTCYMYVIFLFQYLLEIRYFELHVCWGQAWKIHFNITHKMWKLPVLLEKKNKSLKVSFHGVFLPLKWLKLIKEKCCIFKPLIIGFS